MSELQNESEEQSVDVAEIMREIRETLAQRRAERGTPAPILPDLSLPLDEQEGGVLGVGARKSLHKASQLAEAIYVDYPIRWRNPIVGRAWAVVRRKIHGEVRTYVDAMVARQMAFNSAVVRVIQRLVEHLEARRAEDRIAALEEEVERLRQRIAELDERDAGES